MESCMQKSFLNKLFNYTDTSDNFKIQKDSKGYFVTQSLMNQKKKMVLDQQKRKKLAKISKKCFSDRSRW